MSLEPLRDEIDAIDLEILRLLNKRHHACVQVGELKRETQQNVLDPAREGAILQRLEDLNTGPFPNEALRDVYASILKASQDEQRRIVEGG